MNVSSSGQQWLIDRLQDVELYDHPVRCFEVIETHISWVILTGDFAYKIKKPLDFGFLDFSSLEKRRFNCCEELRLNRRLAPHVYLDLVTISGSKQRIELNGPGPAIEYAVKMAQFPQTAQLDCLPAENGLTDEIMARLAEKVAHFHLSVAAAPKQSEWGGVEHVRKTVVENFEHIRRSVRDPAHSAQLAELEHWSTAQLETLAAEIAERKALGFVRECHGDMHLRNIAWWKDDIVIFDCIEFNAGLRFIDVVSEIAFLIMDLEVRRKKTQASHFLNSYLRLTGDFAGLKLLRFYKVYRALVRAKVDILLAVQEQPGSKAQAQTLADFDRYLGLAEDYTRPPSPLLLVSHGMSGTGKSFGARLIADRMAAIVISSDVERKRIFADTDSSSPAALEKGLYTPEITSKTYARLGELARSLLTAGYSVIVDAANLKRAQRAIFANLAKSLHVPRLMLCYTAAAETLRSRVDKRARSGTDISDATVAILEHQLGAHEPLTADERLCVIEIDTEQTIDIEQVLAQIGNAR